jgi:hypothetical protein
MEAPSSPDEPMIAARPLPLAPRAARGARRAREAPALPDAAHGLATIEVTIGRIEVRAVHPAQPPPARRDVPAALTLDQYLRERHEGRR